jgi:hypothetical protein
VRACALTLVAPLDPPVNRLHRGFGPQSGSLHSARRDAASGAESAHPLRRATDRPHRTCLDTSTTRPAPDPRKRLVITVALDIKKQLAQHHERPQPRIDHKRMSPLPPEPRLHRPSLFKYRRRIAAHLETPARRKPASLKPRHHLPQHTLDPHMIVLVHTRKSRHPVTRRRPVIRQRTHHHGTRTTQKLRRIETPLRPPRKICHVLGARRPQPRLETRCMLSQNPRPRHSAQRKPRLGGIFFNMWIT